MGTRGRTGSPASRWSAALHCALPPRSSASKCAARCGSVAGFHSSTSMPFRTPTQIASALGEDAVEAAAVGGGLDLARVGRAHRREQRAAVERGLGEVERAEVLELARVVVLRPEAGDEHRAAVVHALIGEVVDGVDGGAAVQRLRPLDGVDVDRDERRLPVVRVDHVGNPAERLRQLERAPRQEGEALEVVRVGVGRGPVEVRAVEVAVMLEEVDRHLAAGQPAEADPRMRRPEPHRHRQDALERLELRATACRRRAA